MNTITTHEALTLAAQAASWPTIAELAESSGIPGRSLRRAVADGSLPAVRLNVLRVNPDDFAVWLTSRQR